MAHLFSPLTILHCTLRNRIVLPPIATERATPRGEVTDKHLTHYAAIAKDGPGLVIVEHTFIRPDGRFSERQLGVCDDSLTPGLARLANAIKTQGAAACLQITHAGSRAKREITGSQPVGAWTIPVPGDTDTPHALRLEELRTMREAYVTAARRARLAGFDAVEIHGAHGYLLGQFVSPLTNQRTDNYGGSVENRLRFPQEVIAAVREAVGSEMLVLYRFGGDDLMPGGLTADDAETIAPMLVDSGLDILDVSGGLGGSGRDRFTEQGFFVPMAARVKRAVGVPTIGIGNVRDPGYAERVIRDGLVDLIAVGRAQVADRNWVSKARQALSAA